MGQASMNMEMMIAMPRILYSMMDVNLNSIVQVDEKLWNYSIDMDDSHTFKIKISSVFIFSFVCWFIPNAENTHCILKEKDRCHFHNKDFEEYIKRNEKATLSDKFNSCMRQLLFDGKFLAKVFNTLAK